MEISRQLDEVVALLDVAQTPALVALLRGRKDWLERAALDGRHGTPTQRPDSDTWYRLRRACLERDEHICQGCATKAGIKDVHHIIPCENGGSTTLGNLIVLCRRCHKQIHPWLVDGDT